MKPPMPLTDAQAAVEYNTHQIEFLDKVAPYNAGEAAWFPRHVAEAKCMAGVAKPLLCKDPESEELIGEWDLSGGQKRIAQQMNLTRATGAGDYAKQIAEEEAERRKEMKIAEADAEKVNQHEETGPFSRSRAEGTAAPTPESSESAEGN